VKCPSIRVSSFPLRRNSRTTFIIAAVGELLYLSRADVRPGRRSPEEITLHKSPGHAVEDAATARFVYDRARALGVGTGLPL